MAKLLYTKRNIRNNDFLIFKILIPIKILTQMINIIIMKIKLI